MRWELKSIAIWPLVRVSFLYNLVIGLIFGLVAALVLGFFMAVSSALPAWSSGDIEVQEYSLGGLIVILPLVISIGGAVLNTLLGVVMVSVYNVVARMVGGLEFNLVEIAAEPTASSPTPAPSESVSPSPPTGPWRPSPLPRPPAEPRGPSPDEPPDPGNFSQS
jgi:hypothetical protein